MKVDGEQVFVIHSHSWDKQHIVLTTWRIAIDDNVDILATFDLGPFHQHFYLL